MTKSFIEQSFQKLRSAEGAFELVQNFQNIQSRESINQSIDERYKDILSQYTKELDNIGAIFHAHKSSPPIYKNYPPVAGSIAWARDLYNRAKKPILRFKVSIGCATIPSVNEAVAVPHVVIFSVGRWPCYSTGMEREARCSSATASCSVEALVFLAFLHWCATTCVRRDLVCLRPARSLKRTRPTKGCSPVLSENRSSKGIWCSRERLMPTALTYTRNGSSAWEPWPQKNSSSPSSARCQRTRANLRSKAWRVLE